ncbi:thermonuclease family protein [Nitratireductor sp. CAU 1489]|uniref:Thermonuclease family protein n=1 Tax=Nitratireductor arenosus TaxID=2682096 RepID=A0A844QH83_9HYPH|nr:thermonuclease family protein [Nitratireductor arenosus]MVA98507.1 thermonuclease family protein [Nitratireductor arenosus]
MRILYLASLLGLLLGPTPAAFAQSDTSPMGAARTIAPDIVAPPAIDPEEIERVAPRAPLSEIGPARPPGPLAGETDWTLVRPLVTAAGRLEVGGVTVVLAGIDIIEPERRCRGRDGGRWPCGMRARTALRGFLRGRTVACDPAGDGGGAVRRASCRLGARDLGAWLVENGWAMAAGNGPYADAQRRAIDNKRGIFADEGVDPAPSADAPPVSILPADEAASGLGG